MSTEPILSDYLEGYRFRFTCKSCGYGWVMTMEEILRLPGIQPELTTDDLPARIRCRSCQRRGVRMTVMGRRPQHHFIGGLS